MSERKASPDEKPMNTMRQTMHELNPNRRRPVRIPNLAALIQQGTSRQSTFTVPTSARTPLHVVKTPLGPRLVQTRRNIGIGYQNNNFEKSSNMQQRKSMVARKASGPDLDTTTAGIEPLMSPSVPLEKFYAPMERKAQRVPAQNNNHKSRRTNLRELAIKNSASKAKKEAANATATVNIPLRLNMTSVPNAPKLVLSSKKVKSEAVGGAMKRTQLKSSTITSKQAALEHELNLAQHSANSTLHIDRIPLIPPTSVDKEENVPDKVTNIPFHLPILANMQEQNALKEIALAAAANALATCHSPTNFKLLDQDLQNNVKDQERIQTALDNLHKKGLELQGEMLALKSEYGKKFNEFMEESRKFVKCQTMNEIIPTLAAPVDVLGTKQEESPKTSVHPINTPPLIEFAPPVASVATTPQTPSRRSLRIAAQSSSTDVNIKQLSEKKSIETDPALDVPQAHAGKDTDHNETPENVHAHEPVGESEVQVDVLIPELQMTPRSITRRSQRLSVQITINTPSEQSLPETLTDLPQSGADRTLRALEDTLRITDTNSPLPDRSLNNTSPLKRNHTLSSSAKQIKKSRVQLSTASTSTTRNESDEENDIPSTASGPNSGRASLNRSKTFVVEEQADVQRKSMAKSRRSIIDYRQLQASFHGVLQTPSQTPMNKSTKKVPLSAMDTPSNISRRVQSALELLYDSP